MANSYFAFAILLCVFLLTRHVSRNKSPSYISATYFIAAIHAGLGQKDQAWAWLEKAYDERATWLSMILKVDPRLDSLRSDPRFRDLLRRMNLPAD